MTNKEITQYIDQFRKKGANLIMAVDAVVQAMDYNGLKAFERKLPYIYHGLLKLPYLKRKSYEGVFTSGYLIEKKTPLEYLDIYAYIFEKNAPLINKLIQYRDKIEISVLKGQYEDAYDCLHRINSEISYSYWAAITEIRITRLNKGLNACNDRLQEILNQFREFAFLVFFNYQTSSIDISFEDEIDTIYNQLYGNDYELNYVIAHCFPFKGYCDGEWQNRDFDTSLVDLYISFMHLLTRHLSEVDVDETVKSHICHLAEVVNDPILVKYARMLRRDVTIDNNERTQIISLFLKKDPSVIQDCRQYLFAHPNDFIILDIWIRSLIRTNSEFSLNKDESLFAKVAYYYYKYMRYGGNHNLYYSRLANIYNALHNFVCFRHLGEMVESRHRSSVRHIYDNAWKYSVGVDLNDAAFYPVSERSDFIRNYYALHGAVMSLPFDQEFSFLQLTQDKIDDDKICKIADGLQANAYPKYLKGLLSAFLIESYMQRSMVKEAVLLYVSQKINDLYAPIKIDVVTIKSALEENGLERQLDIPLEMSIFHTITNSISSKRKLAYRRYLNKRGVTKASQLSVEPLDKMLLYFLTEVIDADVLSLDALHFKSTGQVLEERIKIYQNLFKATQDKDYYNYMAQLENEMVIKGMTKTLDQSKIFVDTDALLERELDYLRDLYAMFVHTGDSVKKLESEDMVNHVKTVVSSVKKSKRLEEAKPLYDYIEKASACQEIDYKNSLFRQFYIEIRNKFLLDPKYGLDYHLSTRIRHGFLANQIRTNFLDKHLVTNIGADNQYALDTYWIEQLPQMSENSKEMLQQRLLAFTKYVDEIIQTLKGELIQVRTEKDNVDKNNSCFDYSEELLTEPLLMARYGCTSRSFNSAVGLVFDSLWSHTEFCLQLMKDQLDDIALHVQAEFDKLEHDIILIIPPKGKGVQRLKAAITDGKTQFQNDIQAVSQWFNRRNDIVAEFKLDLSLTTCIDTINRINHYKIEAERDIHSMKTYKGVYLSRFNDLFHILLNNVLDYNKDKQRNGKCRITLLEKDNWLTLQVANAIDEDDEEKVKKETTINQVEIDELLSRGKSRGEGHSGKVKIYNIVHNVFNNPENSYSYQLTNGELYANIKINISNLVQ